MKAAIQKTFAVLFACLLFLSGCNFSSQGKSFSGVEFIMDTFVEHRWYGKNAQQAYTDINQKLREIESELSWYFPKSDISKLNQAAGKHPVALSDG